MSQANVDVVRRVGEEARKRSKLEPVEYIEAGDDAVLFVFRLVLEIRGTVYTSHHWWVFGFRDGEMMGWDAYLSEDEARKAAGL